MAEPGEKVSVGNTSTVEHGEIDIEVSCVFHHDEVSTYANCSSLLFWAGFGLGLFFSRTNTAYVVGRFREVSFGVQAGWILRCHRCNRRHP